MVSTVTRIAGSTTGEGVGGVVIASGNTKLDVRSSSLDDNLGCAGSAPRVGKAVRPRAMGPGVGAGVGMGVGLGVGGITGDGVARYLSSSRKPCVKLR